MVGTQNPFRLDRCQAVRGRGRTARDVLMNPSMATYLPILYFAVMAAIVPVAGLAAMSLLRPSKPTPTKLAPYECGVASPTEAFDHRFSVRYYLIAVLFVVFDVETVFLFPWAVMYHRLRLFGLVEMLVFLVILVVGYVYAWRRGALSWA
jgi:NADH-quinone oxidoreductase subunit A